MAEDPKSDDETTIEDILKDDKVEGTPEDNDKLQQDDEDPIDAAVNARLEAEREKLAQEVREELRKENEERIKAEAAVAANQRQVDELLNSFGNTVKEIRNNVKQLKFFDAEGNEVTVPDNVLEEYVVKPLQKYNSTGQRAASLQVLQALSSAALESLPEEHREDFTKKVGGKNIKEWLTGYAETLAPKTEYVKKLEKDVEAKVKAAEARGYKRGQTAPTGQPDAGPGRAPDRNVDLTTASGLARALKDGKIDDSKFRELWAKVT